MPSSQRTTWPHEPRTRVKRFNGAGLAYLVPGGVLLLAMLVLWVVVLLSSSESMLFLAMFAFVFGPTALAMVLIGATIRWWRSPDHNAPHACPACGYDLLRGHAAASELAPHASTHVTSGQPSRITCPECGQ